jgi:hypothetical protein
MKQRLLVLFLALLSTGGCSVELKMRSLQGPYDGFRDQAEADAVALARQALAEGKPDAAVIEALVERGFSQAEARRIVLLAFLSPPAAATK